MFDHVLRVGDFESSLAFYTAALAPLGIQLAIVEGEAAAFGDARTFLLTGGRGSTTNVHVALRRLVWSVLPLRPDNGARHSGPCLEFGR